MLIEFKLHAGKVPYFVKRFISIPPIGGKYYGEALADPTSYIPIEVVVLEEAEWVAIVKTGAMQKPNPDHVFTDYKSPRTIPMDETEKLAFIEEWLRPTKKPATF